MSHPPSSGQTPSLITYQNSTALPIILPTSASIKVWKEYRLFVGHGSLQIRKISSLAAEYYKERPIGALSFFPASPAPPEAPNDVLYGQSFHRSAGNE